MDEPRFRELIERHLEGHLSEAELEELAAALEKDPGLRRRAAEEAALSTVLAGLMRPSPFSLVPRVQASLRDPEEKTRQVRRVMDALPAVRALPPAWRLRLVAAAAGLVVAAGGLAYWITRPGADEKDPETSVTRKTAVVEAASGGGARPPHPDRPSPGTPRVVPFARPKPDSGPSPSGPGASSYADGRALYEIDPNLVASEGAADPLVPPAPAPDAPMTRADTTPPPVRVPGPVVASLPEVPVREPPERKTSAASGTREEPAGTPATTAMTVSRPREVAWFVSPGRGVLVVSNDEQRQAEPEASVRTGETIRVPGRSTTGVRFEDGTRLDLEGPAMLELADGADLRGGYRIRLPAGILRADVARQVPGRPFAIETPWADVEVLGTRFSLVAEKASTRLEVLEGRVRLVRRADHAAVDVAGGQYAVAAEGAPLAVMPLHANRPALVLEVLPAPAEANLTAEGSADWVHWHWDETVRIVRKKGARALGNLSVVDAARIGGYVSSSARVGWADGFPVARGSGTGAGLQLTGAANGFLVSAPADVEPRVLRLYAGVAGATARLEAVLSDGSAPPVTDLSLRGTAPDPQQAVYELRYAAGRDGQTLTLRMTVDPESAVTRRDARRPAAGEESSRRAPERETGRRSDPALVLQAVTLSEAMPDKSKTKKDPD